LGHEVIVANPRKVRLISDNDGKDDPVDAELLARLGRVDVKLLSPIQHRGEEAQADLAVIRARTQLVNHVRGAVKSLGARLEKSSTRSFGDKMGDQVPEALQAALEPVLEVIAELTSQIGGYDQQIRQSCQQKYPETALLTAVPGVGALTALGYVLTLEDPHRFASSRLTHGECVPASITTRAASCPPNRFSSPSPLVLTRPDSTFSPAASSV